ncbi:hypothetical protein ABZ912_57440 [Nonomuraea angiospora]|uniref:hypothetical protein n=1 Tax=Nonomuraea angiospora TaxID=46172 RepID=UPI0033E0C634
MRDALLQVIDHIGREEHQGPGTSLAAGAKRLFNALAGHPPPLEQTTHWSARRRRHRPLFQCRTV